MEWNGFLNVVGGMLTHEPSQPFSDGPQYPVQQGYSDQFTFDQQSSAGLQAFKRLDDTMSVTLQLFSQGSVDDYQAQLKWLYLTWEPDDHSSIRLGHLGAPVYYFSDFLNVGYAYHWVTPPEAAYPFDYTITGIGYTYQETLEHFDWSLELLAGAGDEYAPNIRSRLVTRNNRTAVFTLSSQGWLTFRAQWSRFDTTLELDDLSDANLQKAAEMATDTALELSGLPPSVTSTFRPILIDDTLNKLDAQGQLSLKDIPVNYGEMAVRMETGQWMLMGELIGVFSDAYLSGNTITGFITGGMRDGAYFYHLTLCNANQQPAKAVRTDRYYKLPESPTLTDYSDALAAGIRSGLAAAFGRSQQAVSVGINFNASENTVLKFDLTRIRERATFEGDTFGVGFNTLIRTAVDVTF